VTQFVPPPNPKKSEIHLASLRQEVNTWAGDLDAGETFPVGVQDIQRYQQAKIKFSNPKSNLERLTPTMFDKVNVPLSARHVKQMRNRFDFYHMTLSVQMRPEPGTYFRALGCQLNFSLTANGEPIVVSIFPDEQWQVVFKFGGSLSLNLDGNLGFEVGITAADTAVLQTLPANLQSKIVNQNEMKSIIQVPQFSYARGRFNIAAYGSDGAECYWYLDNQEISQTLTAQFTIIFKVPQGTDAISLTAVAWAEPDMDKLTANFRHVIKRFQDSIRDLFRRSNKGAREFAITVGEKWRDLPLPPPSDNIAAAPAKPATTAEAAVLIDQPPAQTAVSPINHLQAGSQFGKLLTKWFDEAELRTLCLDIGYHYENLPGRSKPERAQELALLTLREGTFNTLQSYCKNKRPHVDWDIFE
jgi:Effector-associated domain 7